MLFNDAFGCLVSAASRRAAGENVRDARSAFSERVARGNGRRHQKEKLEQMLAKKRKRGRTRIGVCVTCFDRVDRADGAGPIARETERRTRVQSRTGTYRSFTEEHGLKNSAFAYIVTPSGARRLILTMGVSPIVSRMLSYSRALVVTATARRAGAARRVRT